MQQCVCLVDSTVQIVLKVGGASAVGSAVIAASNALKDAMPSQGAAAAFPAGQAVAVLTVYETYSLV